jgi:hypothetical protein
MQLTGIFNAEDAEDAESNSGPGKGSLFGDLFEPLSLRPPVFSASSAFEWSSSTA